MGKTKNQGVSNDTPFVYLFVLISTAARTVENEEKENDHNNPSKCFIFKKVT